MVLVGLTGGIGSGKSTVGQHFALRGAHVIDADAVARRIVEPGQPALDALVERFGEHILRPDGTLDRQGLARIVFADDEARSDLEAITHPHIAARIAAEIAELSERPEPPRLIVVDHPLLIETGQADVYDAVVVVVAPEQVRIDRLCARGLERDDVEARMNAQTDDETRRRHATHVIDNSAGPDELAAAADAVFDLLVADA